MSSISIVNHGRSHLRDEKRREFWFDILGNTFSSSVYLESDKNNKRDELAHPSVACKQALTCYILFVWSIQNMIQNMNTFSG